MIKTIKKLFAPKPVMPAIPVAPPARKGISSAAKGRVAHNLKAAKFEVKPPQLMPGVVPPNARSDPQYMALDGAPLSPLYEYLNEAFYGLGFPGYPYLSDLTQRSEYRSPAETIASEMTRKWIKITATGDDDLGDKIAAIETALKKHKVRSIFQTAALQDGFFGRAQIYINIRGVSDESRKQPLIVSSATIKKGSLVGFKNIEALWTTPYSYNSDNPMASDFYKPTAWFVLGKQTHATRLLTLISREVPDLLKPAYNFGGQSLSQLMQPYVDAWLRTRDSVNDLIHTFSLSGIKTDLSSILNQGNGGDLFDRVDFYNQMKDNNGLMILGQGPAGEAEEFFQFNTPLSGLDALQAQAQEHMAAPSHIPLVKLLGITPTGLNASSEGELMVFYDFIHASQENFFGDALKTVIDIIQLDLFGEIDDGITFEFVPLMQLDGKALSEVRKSDSDAAVALINAGVISAEEERARLAADPNSGYNALDVEDLPEAAEDNSDALDDDKQAADAGEFKEGDHPRANNGQFGSGGGSGTAGKPQGRATPPKVLPDNHPLLNESINDRSESAQAERKGIEAAHFENAKPVTGRKPVIYFMGGGGGSGKGTLKKQLQSTGKLPTAADGAVSIDPDEIKTSLQRFKDIKAAGDYRAASVTHEDSSALSKTILEKAKQGNYDIVFDATLSDSPKAHARFKEFAEAGYEVKLFSVTAEPEAATERAFSRWEHSGRYVDPNELKKAHNNFNDAVISYQTSPHMAEANHYTNYEKLEHANTVIKGVKQ